MDRRHFVRAVGFCGAAVATPSIGAGRLNAGTAFPNGQKIDVSAPRKALMKVGTQHGASDEILRTLAALGVNNICGPLPSASLDDRWSEEGLTRLRERVESFGIRLDMLP